MSHAFLPVNRWNPKVALIFVAFAKPMDSAFGAKSCRLKEEPLILVINRNNLEELTTCPPTANIPKSTCTMAEHGYACRIPKKLALFHVFFTFFDFSVLTQMKGQPTNVSKAPSASEKSAHNTIMDL